MDSTEFKDGYAAGIANRGTIMMEEGRAPFVVVPSEYRVENLEGFAARPNDKRGHAALTLTAASSEYVARHKRDGTTIFVDRDAAVFTAIIDGHEAGNPGWGRHTASLMLTPTPEWVQWNERDSTAMDQKEFAEFLEDHLGEIAHPDAALLLETCADLKAVQSLDFHQGITLANGAVQFTYNEHAEAKSATRALEVPGTFSLYLRVFEGTSHQAMNARLRWRIEKEGGKLRFFYKLVRPYDVRLLAVDAEAEIIEAALGAKPLAGQWVPEGSVAGR